MPDDEVKAIGLNELGSILLELEVVVARVLDEGLAGLLELGRAVEDVVATLEGAARMLDEGARSRGARIADKSGRGDGGARCARARCEELMRVDDEAKELLALKLVWVLKEDP